MKTIALTLFAATLGFAQASSSTSTTPSTAANPSTSAAQKKAPPVAKKPQPKAGTGTQAVTIPSGAVQIEPYLYRYTDSSGKTWNYRKTPFGVSKYEENSLPAPPPTAAKSEPVVVTDLGDSYRFEKKTPFGGSTWVHKKTELTDDDKALLSHSDDVATKTKEEK
jgi:hypothetical protein